jgi:hypothetical protein
MGDDGRGVEKVCVGVELVEQKLHFYYAIRYRWHTFPRFFHALALMAF